MKRALERLRRVSMRRWVVVTTVVAVALWLGVSALLHSGWLAERVRLEIVERIRAGTGADVEAAGVEIEPAGAALIVRELTLADPRTNSLVAQLPLIRVEIGVESLLRRDFYLAGLRLERPSIDLSQAGRLGGSGDEITPGGLLAMRLGRLEIVDGVATLAGEEFRGGLSAESFDLDARRGATPDRYEIELSSGTLAWGENESLFQTNEAALQLTLLSDRVEAQRIRVRMGDSVLRAEGSLELAQPLRLALTYQGEISAADWPGRLPPDAQIEARARLNGELTWNGGAEPTLSYGGTLSAEGVRAGAAGMEASDAAVSGTYSGDASRVRFPSLAVSVFGGRFEGFASASAPWSEPRYSIEGNVDGFELRPAASAALARMGSQLGELPWRSRVGAWLRLAGTGARTFEAAGTLILDSSQAGPPELPALDGVVSLAYRSQENRVELRRLDLAVPTAALSVSGEARPGAASAFDLSLALSGLDDLASASGWAGVPWNPSGLRLEGDALIAGRLQAVTGESGLRLESFGGRLNSEAFQLRGQRWESLEADVGITPRRLDLSSGTLRAEEGVAAFSLSAVAPDRGGWALAELSGEARIEALPVEAISQSAGLDLAADGILKAELSIEGTAINPTVDASVGIIGGRAWEQPFDSLRTRATVNAKQIQLASLEIAREGMLVSGSGEYSWAERSFAFDLESAEWRLEQLADFSDWTRAPAADLFFNIRGEAHLGSGEKLFEELKLDGDWTVGELSWGEQQFGSLAGRLRTEGESVRLDWSGELLGGKAQGQTTVLPDENAFSGEASFTGFQAAELTRAVSLPLPGLSGETGGSLGYSGDLSAAEKFTAEGVIDRAAFEISGIPGARRAYEIWNPFPMRWSFSDGTLALDRMRLLGVETDIEVSGKIPTAPERPIDLSVDGNFNLALIESYNADLQADGTARVGFRLLGSRQSPDLRGEMELREASLRSVDFPNGLSGINGDVVFRGRTVRIGELRAASGGGTLVFSGAGHMGLEAFDYRLNLDARGVRVRYPANVSSLVEGRLTLAGTSEQGILSGDMLVSRISTSQRVTLGELLSSLRQPSRTAQRGSMLEDLQLNVHLGSAPNLHIETSLIQDVEGELDLRVVGTAASPSLLGRAGITRGRMNYHGSRYHVNRGDVSFVNPFRIEPLLFFEFETRIRDVDIALTLSGPARRINLSYRSDPPLTFSDLVNLVAIGRAPTTDPVLAAQDRVQQQSLLQSGANTMFSEAVSSPVSPGLQRFFGVTRLKVDPGIGGPGGTASPRISTEQQITNDLTLIYTFDVSSAQQQTIRVEWAPNRTWSLIVTRDEEGLVGSDVLYKKRLR